MSDGGAHADALLAEADVGGLAGEDEPPPEDDFASGLARREANILDNASDEETDTAALLAFSIALLFPKGKCRSLPVRACQRLKMDTTA